MTLIKTAFCAVFFGSLYTIFRKFQSVIELHEHSEQFNEPILQSFIIFIGMATIMVFKPWIKHTKQQQFCKISELPSDNKYIYIVPSLLDVLGTIVDTAGLYYTSVSVSQMLKGSVLFFTYLITLFYLKKALIFKKHMYMILILASLMVIGASNATEKTSKYQSSPILGNVLIIISQLLFSLMFVYEERILKKYQIKVENCVFWEGIWGALFSGIMLIAFMFFQTPIKSNVVKSCFLICNNWKLLVAVLLTAMCIGPFNYFGISLTKQGSALQRCMICTMRMIVVWAISLIFKWQEFHLIQLIGYCLLTWSIYKFNQCDIPIQQNAEVTFEEQKMGLNFIKQEQVLDSMDTITNFKDFWNTFTYYLLVNSTEEPTYLITRQHFGSFIAFGLAGYNTFLLKQKIIKNAIHLTKSNNPKIVTGGCLVVGSFYYTGLAIIWHVPSFFAQLGVRVYCSAQNAMTSHLFKQNLKKQIFSDQRIEQILKKYK